MKKKPEIALSYAHKDIEIANILEKELRDIFADRFFMDNLKKEELANAKIFKESLKTIFQDSHYSIILFSKNYIEGTFTRVEQEAIAQMAPHFFIINIDNCSIPSGPLSELTYINLNVFSSTNTTSTKSENQTIDWPNVHTQIYDIIHNQIIKYMINKSITDRKQQKEYSFNIQTLFTGDNSPIWKMDYDWNLITRAFIEEDGRKVKKISKLEEITKTKSVKTGWDAIWKYIENTFCYIKNHLNEESDSIIRKIHFNCHLSIAFKLGQLYGDLRQASGNRNLILSSSNKVSNITFALEKEPPNEIIEDFCQEYDGNNCNSTDIICIISINPQPDENIIRSVTYSLKKYKQEYCKIYLFQKKTTIPTVANLESMGNYLRNKMENCRPDNTCKIHLFSNTTAPLMFVLGARTIFHGKIQLYEYIGGEDSYEKSLTNE